MGLNWVPWVRVPPSLLIGNIVCQSACKAYEMVRVGRCSTIMVARMDLKLGLGNKIYFEMWLKIRQVFLFFSFVSKICEIIKRNETRSKKIPIRCKIYLFLFPLLSLLKITEGKQRSFILRNDAKIQSHEILLSSRGKLSKIEGPIFWWRTMPRHDDKITTIRHLLTYKWSKLARRYVAGPWESPNETKLQRWLLRQPVNSPGKGFSQPRLFPTKQKH